jgi:hypothetical protein
LTMSMTQIYGKLPIKNNLAFAGWTGVWSSS